MGGVCSLLSTLTSSLTHTPYTGLHTSCISLTDTHSHTHLLSHTHTHPSLHTQMHLPPIHTLTHTHILTLSPSTHSHRPHTLTDLLPPPHTSSLPPSGFLEELSTLRRYTYKEVRGVGRNRNTPVLVHCSAGVGRSGVTILCDLLLEATDHNLPLDPPKVLQHLRQQRMALVQTIAQYKLVYQVLLAYLNRARLI